MIPSKKDLQAICDLRFSPEVYEKLQEASVAIAGLGGLGSNIAVMLTRTGIGKLKLVDFDQVDLSNLNRQVYDIRHLGQLKTEALSQRLKELNPYIELELYSGRITEDNVWSVFRGCRYICEAFDGAEDKAMLAQQVLCGLPEAYLVSGSGMAGYGDADQIHTRKVNSRFFVCGDECSDAAQGIGLMAPRVAVCAGHQANKIIQLILEER
ncbi:sulfur carrier protein ThiS adenylyltransferase ThiF [Hominibacterium faecale]|uniref:sulfur carrier protein ThiS adenylyltransferase ThiF n=1 Tax=Hominibacterium faecale TaxID=2839743 RepID=UPI0022B29837|nr:sulfur carrier protein ThiS adenylyltransferase ThiF [Hominibacterium faecale]